MGPIATSEWFVCVSEQKIIVGTEIHWTLEIKLPGVSTSNLSSLLLPLFLRKEIL